MIQSTQKSKSTMAASTRGKKRVSFAIRARPGAAVFVAGAFNNWDPESHPLSDPVNTGQFTKMLYLPKGSHEYCFVVDGKWTHDPANSETRPNPFGGFNSVLVVA
jgi:1,4-alpha-glucan branching enzyme